MASLNLHLLKSYTLAFYSNVPFYNFPLIPFNNPKGMISNNPQHKHQICITHDKELSINSLTQSSL